MPRPALKPSRNLSDVESAATSRTNLGLGTAAVESASAFAAAVHGHAIADVTGLQTALDAKAALAGATFTGTINGTSVVLSGALSAADGSGTNQAGTSLVIQPGQSTGNATPATVKVQGTTVGSSGATLQTLADMVSVGPTAVTSGLSGVLSCNDVQANGVVRLGTGTTKLEASINPFGSGRIDILATSTAGLLIQSTNGSLSSYIWLSNTFRRADCTCSINVDNPVSSQAAGRFRGASGQTANILEVLAFGGSSALWGVGPTGAMTPASMADSAAPNGSLYYSTTANKLVFKDAGGVVNALY